MVAGTFTIWSSVSPSPKSLPLSLCCIVRNEVGLLPGLLRSVRDVATQIVVVDTGSTDGTPEVAREHGATLVQTTWHDDFALARNIAVHAATQPWALILDADERLLASGARAISRAIQQPGTYALRIQHTTLDGQPRSVPSWRPSLFQPQAGLAFYGRVHEELRWHAEHGSVPVTYLPNGPHVTHVGYDPSLVVSRDKDARNLRLLELQLADTPGDVYVLLLMARHHLQAGRQDEAQRWMQRCRLANIDRLQPVERAWLMHHAANSAMMRG